MDKFIMTIGGSPRKNGFSAKMLKCFTESLRQHSVEHCLSIRHYDAYSCDFMPCTDCRACCKFEGCVNHDMDEFFADFERCDAIVIATPIYNMSFPAPLKVMIDRMQRYFSARFSLGKRPPIAKHRPVILLASGGDVREDGAFIVKQLERIFTVTNCELVDSVVLNGTDKLDIKDFPDERIRDVICDLTKTILN